MRCQRIRKLCLLHPLETNVRGSILPYIQAPSQPTNHFFPMRNATYLSSHEKHRAGTAHSKVDIVKMNFEGKRGKAATTSTARFLGAITKMTLLIHSVHQLLLPRLAVIILWGCILYIFTRQGTWELPPDPVLLSPLSYVAIPPASEFVSRLQYQN